MKRLSTWGRLHPWPARYLIIASHVLLCCLALLCGILLHQLGLVIPGGIFVAAVIVYLLSFMAYPFRVQKRRELNAAAYYVRQKICDLGLLASGFILVVFFANRPEKILVFDTLVKAATPSSFGAPADSTLKKYKSIADFSASMKDANGTPLKWKEKKKLLKEQVRAIKQSKEMSDGGKVGLIVLSVAVALGLLYLVTNLACNLSCSGEEGAATLVMIGGTGLIILLTIIAIRAIVGRKKKKELSGSAPKGPEPPQKKE